MATIFDQELSNVSAAPSINTPTLASSVPIISSANVLGEGLAGLGKVLSGVAKIRGDEKDRQVSREVDTAIDRSFEAAFNIQDNTDIDLAMDRLSTLKQASNQGKDVSDRFNLTLMSEAKRLRTQFPDRADAINKALVSRGLIDPRASLLGEQAKIESTRRATEEMRLENAVTEAFKQGIAVYNEPGNINSGVDRQATLSMLQRANETSQQNAAIMKQLGVVKDAKGEVSFTYRDEYLQAQPTLRKNVFDTALIGIRPYVNQLQTLLNNAGPANIKEIQSKFAEISNIANQFRLNEQAKASSSLNEKEAEDYMKFVDGTISGLTRSIVDLKDSNDLNAMKNAAFAFDVVSKNMQVMNVNDAPVLSQLSLLDRGLVTSLLSVGKFQLIGELGTMANKELKDIVDMVPKQRKTPPDQGINLGGAENNYGTEQKKSRLDTSFRLQQDFINKSIVTTNSDDTFVWVQSQSPVYNAMQADRLSPNDVKRLSAQIVSPNYQANLENAFKFHPEGAKKVAAYSFEVVERNLMNLSREINRGGLLNVMRKGEDYDIILDPSTKQFKAVASDAAITRARAAGVTRDRNMPLAGVPEITNRVNEINRAIPHLLRTKQYKSEYQGVSDTDFLEGLSAFVNGVQ